MPKLHELFIYLILSLFTGNSPIQVGDINFDFHYHHTTIINQSFYLSSHTALVPVHT